MDGTRDRIFSSVVLPTFIVTVNNGMRVSSHKGFHTVGWSTIRIASRHLRPIKEFRNTLFPATNPDISIHSSSLLGSWTACYRTHLRSSRDAVHSAPSSDHAPSVSLSPHKKTPSDKQKPNHKPQLPLPNSRSTWSPPKGRWPSLTKAHPPQISAIAQKLSICKTHSTPRQSCTNRFAH
jgi:hypothetical protein